MRSRARQVFEGGTVVILVLIIAQVGLAGLGIFVNWPVFLSFWHAGINAGLIGLVPLLLILVGWYGGVPVRTRWLMAAIPGLVVVQSLLLIPYHMGPAMPPALHAISALHVINAFFIFWVALRLVASVRKTEAGRLGEASATLGATLASAPSSGFIARPEPQAGSGRAEIQGGYS